MLTADAEKSEEQDRDYGELPGLVFSIPYDNFLPHGHSLVDESLAALSYAQHAAQIW
jgi:hypothetical protein